MLLVALFLNGNMMEYAWGRLRTTPVTPYTLVIFRVNAGAGA